MTWKQLYAKAITRPGAMQYLMRSGMAAAVQNGDVDLRRWLNSERALGPFVLCDALDTHGVDVPPSAEHHLDSLLPGEASSPQADRPSSSS
jgi:hypothetical protein